MWALLRHAAARPRGAPVLRRRAATAATEGPRRPVLTLFTKHPCSLCIQAKEVLRPFLQRVELQEVDIMDPLHHSWHERYCHDVPVLHLDGRFIMRHSITADTFEQILAEHEGHCRAAAGAAGAAGRKDGEADGTTPS